MNQVTVQAPCKINLILGCVGRLPSGYHQMDMIMQTISLYDTVTAGKTGKPGIVLSCNDPKVPCNETNIAFRCAQGFFKATGILPDAAITIEKNIPIMAGLGGGSADGAGALVALNRLYGSGLTKEQLCAIALPYGADIPFCIVGGTQRAQGIGEQFTPAPPLPPCWVVVAKPLFSVSTKEAFAQIDAAPAPPRANVEEMLHCLGQGDLEQVGAAMANVFEAFCSPEKIGKIKEEMKVCGAAGALMSGSGSAVFGLFQEEKAARACAACLKPEMESVFVARPLGEQPL